VEETNVYISQKGYNVAFTKEDILGYLGMNIAMGIVCLPELQDYWTRELLLRVPWFPSVTSSKKFKAISRFLHFADNVLALPHMTQTMISYGSCVQSSTSYKSSHGICMYQDQR